MLSTLQANVLNSPKISVHLKENILRTFSSIDLSKPFYSMIYYKIFQLKCFT